MKVLTEGAARKAEVLPLSFLVCIHTEDLKNKGTVLTRCIDVQHNIACSEK